MPHEFAQAHLRKSRWIPTVLGLCTLAMLSYGASGRAVTSDAGVDSTSARDHRTDAATPTPTTPEGFGLQAHIEPSPVPFGETFDLVIEVRHPESMQVVLPDPLPETARAPRNGSPRRQIAKVATTNQVVESIRIPFLALDLEDVKTPAFVLKTSVGSPIEIAALPVPVVDAQAADAGPSSDGSQLALVDAPGPRVYGVFDPRPWMVLSVWVFAVIAVGAYRWAAARQKVPATLQEVSAPEPKAPAHVLALARLDALLAEGLLSDGQTTVFVARLMDDVLRTYLEDRFFVAAGRKTTQELAQDLLSQSTPGLDVAQLRSVLEQADLVKFAKANLGAEVAHDMATRVRRLVESSAASVVDPRPSGAHP